MYGSVFNHIKQGYKAKVSGMNRSIIDQKYVADCLTMECGRKCQYFESKYFRCFSVKF